MSGNRSILPVLLAFLVLAAFGCAHKIVRVSDSKEVPLPEFVDKAAQARLIFAGELHDRKSHHKLQLDIIRALHEAGVDVAIGVEMFSTDAQPDLDRWVGKRLSEDEFKVIYHRNWQIPWRKYKDIFLYAREHAIPVVALNVPRKLTHQVFEKGLSSLSGEQSKGLPLGSECDVDEEYESFIREAVGEHNMKDTGDEDEMYDKFCQAQMLWDASMAKNAVDYLERNPGRKMVVLAGSGHSWKRGIPVRVSRLSDIKYVVILPEAAGVGEDTLTTNDTDYIWTGWFFY